MFNRILATFVRRARRLAALLLCGLVLCAPLARGEALTVTDMTGRAVTLDAPATRVVALTAADCEILCALGKGDTLVGRGAYCDYPEQVLSVPAVQSGYDTNIEQIIALAPQVVVMAKMAQTVEQIARLEDAGIAVVVSDAADIAGTYQAIRLLGALTGGEIEAESLIATMKASFDDLAFAAESAAGKTVYFEVSPLQYGLWTAGAGTFMDELAQLLGLTNAFADVQGWAEVSQEQVIARDPDYIVTITVDYGDGPAPVEEICARAGWQAMKAVTGGNVYAADPNAVSRPGPRLTDAARELHAFVYGQAARDNGQ